MADGITADGRSATIILTRSPANIKGTVVNNGRAEPAGGVRQARPAVTGTVGHRRMLVQPDHDDDSGRPVAVFS